MPKRARDRRTTSIDQLAARVDKLTGAACIASYVPWGADAPAGCPPDAVMYVLMACAGPCPRCRDAKARVWRPASPVNAMADETTADTDDFFGESGAVESWLLLALAAILAVGIVLRALVGS